MVFCGLGVAEVIAAEASLKTKELTYMHCQSFKLNEAGNNFFCFMKKYPGIPAVFIVLDNQKEKHQMIEQIERLIQKVALMAIIVTDIKDKTLKDKLNTLSEGRMLVVQKSGPALSALLCVIPL